jgi:hypothetical protein
MVFADETLMGQRLTHFLCQAWLPVVDTADQYVLPVNERPGVDCLRFSMHWPIALPPMCSNDRLGST